jgi:hypothetical protein
LAEVAKRKGRRAPRIFLAAAAALTFPPAAIAAEQTLTFRTGAITVAPFQTAQKVQVTPSPSVDGFVVGMEADVVDRRGRSVPGNRVVLHHVVFVKVGVLDSTCGNRDASGRVSPIPVERFYGAGEERFRLSLPTGYGYPSSTANPWALLYMLMNHSTRTQRVYIQYKVQYVTDRALTPVRPVWLDVRNCRLDPVFDAPGTGGRGSSHTERTDFRLPDAGRIVAGGGHLHGGGIRLELANMTCARRLFTSRPTWSRDMHRPLLHEPGPTKMSSFRTSTGIQVAAGDVLRLTAVYDNFVPHTRVMGIMLLYLARGETTRCADSPSLDVDLGRPGLPPLVRLSLLRRPQGPLVRGARRAVVRDFTFAPERVFVRRGTRFTWRFAGPLPHDVTLVNGPVGFSSPTVAAGTFRFGFTRRGVYRLHCSIHPARMSQVVIVR